MTSIAQPLCKTLYIGEIGRRLGDRFREHFRDVDKDDKDASKPVACYFNLPNYSKQHMAFCDLSLHQGTTENRKNLEQKFIYPIGTLKPHGIKERFPLNYWIPVFFHVAILPRIAYPHLLSGINQRSKCPLLESLYGSQFTLSQLLDSVDKAKIFAIPFIRVVSCVI